MSERLARPCFRALFFSSTCDGCEDIEINCIRRGGPSGGAVFVLGLMQSTVQGSV